MAIRVLIADGDPRMREALSQTIRMIDRTWEGSKRKTAASSSINPAP